MPQSLMRLLRTTSLTEGVSYILLLFVAMPLKYAFDRPLAVTYVGMAHGVLFIALAIITLVAIFLAKLPFRTACLVGIASLLPGGPFLIDRRLKRHQESLEN